MSSINSAANIKSPDVLQQLAAYNHSPVVDGAFPNPASIPQVAPVTPATPSTPMGLDESVSLSAVPEEQAAEAAEAAIAIEAIKVDLINSCEAILNPNQSPLVDYQSVFDEAFNLSQELIDEHISNENLSDQIQDNDNQLRSQSGEDDFSAVAANIELRVECLHCKKAIKFTSRKSHFDGNHAEKRCPMPVCRGRGGLAGSIGFRRHCKNAHQMTATEVNRLTGHSRGTGYKKFRGRWKQ